MSLLLISRLRKNTARQADMDSLGLSESEQHQYNQIKATRLWLLTYIALFTSLLAFFILIITQVELEGSTPKRNHQKIVKLLYQESLHQKELQGLSWLNVENTLSKGVRLTLDPNVISNNALFTSARAKINPRYLPYLRSLADVIQALSLEAFKQRHPKLVRGIETAGFELKLFVRIEGHTDSRPLAKTALFQNNVELSTFRAYAMMELLRIYTGLPKSMFSMAGYGSFHNLVEDAAADENRRVEIYLLPQIVAIESPGLVKSSGSELTP